ncbi:hypothetical protein AB6A40_003855 [Gnathostoma spinigerum]|uniref:Uncharacterized protein n=1 Tax=Gnathostoma spinigerum TaxID=75299 RepID=A0ABD6ED67_9BILA
MQYEELYSEAVEVGFHFVLRQIHFLYICTCNVGLQSIRKKDNGGFFAHFLPLPTETTEVLIDPDNGQSLRFGRK